MSGILIRGGIVVDGTGAPGYPADVRTSDGVITEIGLSLAPKGEREIDARGAYVTPGFIAPHTHLDGAMFWDSELDPLPAYGVTTAVIGNCGNAIAPLPASGGGRLIDLLCYLEEIPRTAFESAVPLDWGNSWSAYSRTARAQKLAVNIEGYCGHTNVRQTVMGDAAWERAATPDEIEQMAKIVDEALSNGAVGVSVDIMDRDADQNKVPGCFAEQAEFEAILDVLARYPGRPFQFVHPFLVAGSNEIHVNNFARLCKARGIRATWFVHETEATKPDSIKECAELHRSVTSGGADVWPAFVHTPFRFFMNIDASNGVFESMTTWREWYAGPREQKLPLLKDPEWRAKARHDWDHPSTTFGTGRPLDMHDILMLAISETGVGPTNISFAEYLRSKGNPHPSDGLADWIYDNGLSSSLAPLPVPLDEETVVRLIRDPQALPSAHDEGAHLKTFCGAGWHLYLLTHFVRDRGLVSIEETVHAMTAKTAGFFGITERGTIAAGKSADLNVFALNEIELRDEHRVNDLPDGSWRYSRPAAGLRATIVRGEPTYLNGKSTGARPGTVFAPN